MSTTVDTVLQSMRVSDVMPRVYVLGCIERRVTVYSQQVRALNLVHALCAVGELTAGTTIAVVGAGAAGLTCAAGALHRGAHVTLLEREAQVLPIFRKAGPGQKRNRWLHPRVYDWPLPGWSESQAGLPLLDWNAGTLAKVTEELTTGWKACEERWRERLRPVCHADDVQLASWDKTGADLAWNDRSEPGRVSPDEGRFDVVVLAVGFGVERYAPGSKERSYWEPDDLDDHQTFREGIDTPRRWLVSGCGDGGLTDLLRLRLRDLRHENMLMELVGTHEEMAAVEERIRTIEADPRASQPDAARFLTEAYKALDAPFVIAQMKLRDDNEVTLNAPDAFYLRPEASALNRFLVAQLAQARGFARLPGKLDRDIPPVREGDRIRVTMENGREKYFDRVVRRHGPAPALRDFPEVWQAFETRRAEWKRIPALLDQTRDRIWQPGDFGPEERREPAATRDAEAAAAHVARLRAGASDAAVLDAAEQRYRQRVGDEYASLRITMGGVGAVDLALEDIFVDLRCVSEIPEAADTFSAEERRFLAECDTADGASRAELEKQLDAGRYRRWRRLGRDEAGALQRRSIVECMNEPGRSALVILGDPGSGKSTLLQVMALRAATRGSLLGTDVPADETLLPILVRLAAFDEYLRDVESRTPLEEFLAIHWKRDMGLGSEPLEGVFERALERGRALVLLDGLDELITPERRRSVVRQVDRLIDRWAPRGNGFAVTSRVIGYRQEPLSNRHDHVTMLDLDRESVAVFLRRWCRALESWSVAGRDAARDDSAAALIEQRAEEMVRELRREIADRSYLAPLVVNPLMLSMLARLRQSRGGQLPGKRIALYREFTAMLIEQWPEQRSQDARQTRVERHEAPRIRKHLMWLALRMQRDHPRTVTRQQILQILTESCLPFHAGDPDHPTDAERAEAEADGERVLAQLQQVMGIVAERGQDAFGFLHATFQEYFAAGQLALHDAEERWQVIAPHLHHARWREVLLFCVGWPGQESRTRDVDDLVLRVLDAGSAYESQLHRDVMLAADLALEDVGASKAVLDRLHRELMELRKVPVGDVARNARGRFMKLATLGHQPTIDHVIEGLESSEESRRSSTWSWLRGVVEHPRCEPIRQIVMRQLESVEADRSGAALMLVAVIAPLARTMDAVRARMWELLDGRHWQISLQAAGALAGCMEEDAETRARFLRWCRRHPDSMQIDGVIARHWQDRDVQDLLRAIWPAAQARPALHPGAYQAVARLADTDESWRNELLTVLTDPDPDVRRAAVSHAHFAARTHPEVRSALIASTGDSHWSVIRAAYQGLGEIAHVHPDARDTLLDAVKHPDNERRCLAIRSLAREASSNHEVVEMLVPFLDDETPRVLNAAFSALTPLAPQNAAIQAGVERRLRAQEVCAIAERIDTVAPLVGERPELQQRITAYLDHPDSSARAAAIRALAPLAAEDGTLRDRFVDLLDADPPMDDVASAIRALAPWVAESRIQSRLIALLDAENDPVHRAAARALAGHSPLHPDVTQAFLAFARRLPGSMDYRERWHAYAVLDPILTRDQAIDEQVITYARSVSDDPDAAEWLARCALRPPLRDVFERWAGQDSGSDVTSAGLEGLGHWIAEDRVRKRLLDAATEDDPGALHALASIADRDTDARAILLAAIPHGLHDDSIPSSLRSLIPAHSDVRDAFWQLLEQANEPASIDTETVLEVVIGLSALIPDDPRATARLLPWLDARTRHDHVDSELGVRTRRTLARAFAAAMERDHTLEDQLIARLDHLAWQERQGAAWALLARTEPPSSQLMDRLCALLDDRRAEESWSERLTAAEAVLNHRDPRLSAQAIQVAEQALEFGMEPWYLDFGPAIRGLAADVLSGIEPTHRQPELLQRVSRRLDQETSRGVRNSLHNALMKLAAVE